MNESYEKLKARIARARDLEFARDLISWDEEVMMPEGGAKGRADQLATLGSLAHHYFVDEEVGALLEELEPYEKSLPYDSDEASIIRVTRREYEKEVRIPTSLVQEIEHAKSVAHHAWVKARKEDNFALFEPHLAKNVDLQRQWAACFGDSANPYNRLLDKYEPGITYDEISRVFSGLKPRLVALVEQIVVHADRVDESILRFPVSEEVQQAFSEEVTADLGYDYNRGRLDVSAHPFTTHFWRGDVRITTRFMADNFASALMSSVHEAGHGMYEQNTSESLYRTRLDEGTSMSVHESQSRYYENVLGRSRSFWRHYYPRLQKVVAPHLDSVDLETFYRALNHSQPSLIRVEADEVTYGLHIMLRFELENELINGRVQVSDLPHEWNDRMEAYLGIRPPNDADGVLQDIHWSSALFGYFPDYLLGSIFAVQLWNQMQRDIPDVEAQIERGEFAAILDWQRTHIHQHGSKLTFPELAERITGGPLQWEPYMEYLETKYSEIYGL